MFFPNDLQASTAIIRLLVTIQWTKIYQEIQINNVYMRFQMAVGSMVHELFQTAIGHGLRTAEEVQAVCEQLINSQGMASTLYEIQMSVDHMRKELTSFVPKIVRFIEQYITGDNVKVRKRKSDIELLKINYFSFVLLISTVRQRHLYG